MGSPAAYAKVVPRLRLLKSGLLGERVRDLSPPLLEALSALRDTVYASIAEAKDLSSLERLIAARFFSTVDELIKLSPSEAVEIVRSFALVREAEDLLTLARAVADGSPLPRWLPSMEWSSSELPYLLSEIETSPSITRLPELIREPLLRSSLSGALQAYAETKSPEAFTWYSLAAQASILSRALEGLEGQDAVETQKIVCPLFEERLALAALQAWALRVSPRTLARGLPLRALCGTNVNAIASAYERNVESDVVSLATELLGLLRHVRLEGKELRDVMASARKTARVSAVRSAAAAFEGYPYTPALIAAGLVLLWVDLDNLRTALLGIGLGLSQQELEPALA